jgi:hypothetical protein
MSLLSYGLLPTALGCALCFNVLNINLRALLVAPCFIWSSYGASLTHPLTLSSTRSPTQRPPSVRG